jgi:hypothetical protein
LDVIRTGEFVVGEIGSINQSVTINPARWRQSICHWNSLWIIAMTDPCYEGAKSAEIPYFLAARKESICAMLYSNSAIFALRRIGDV